MSDPLRTRAYNRHSDEACENSNSWTTFGCAIRRAAVTLWFIAAATVVVSAFTTATPAGVQQVNAAPNTASCDATDGGFAANRGLAWPDYEFGETADLPMELAGRKCFAKAAAASRDYLAFGPLLSTRQHAITTFHMGRNLAFAGQETEAAVAVASSRRSDQIAGQLDWNTYVQGVYAYLVKDAQALDAALAVLVLSASESDRTNAANLSRLKVCFQRSYLEAMTDSTCAASEFSTH